MDYSASLSPSLRLASQLLGTLCVVIVNSVVAKTPILSDDCNDNDAGRSHTQEVSCVLQQQTWRRVKEDGSHANLLAWHLSARPVCNLYHSKPASRNSHQLVQQMIWSARQYVSTDWDPLHECILNMHAQQLCMLAVLFFPQLL